MNVFISSSSSIELSKEYLDLAYQTAHLFTNYNYNLVVGGISTENSMMNIIYNEFMNKNKEIYIYVVDKYKDEVKDISNNVNIINTTFERIKSIYNNSNIFVILPGGIGSLSEIFAFLEELRTNECDKKLMIYNYNNYYKDIINMINKLIENKFVNEGIKEKIIIIDNISQLENIIKER